MFFPRAAALAELAWSSNEARSFDDFLHRLPADNRRAEDEGIHPAHSVFNVEAEVQPTQDDRRATVTLRTQSVVGDIHYTLDGSPVRADSPLYTSPFDVTLPSVLHAEKLDGLKQTGDLLSQPLTLATALSRDSRLLDPCSKDAGIQLQQDPPRSEDQPVFRVVFYHPCWLYRDPQMDSFHSLSINVGSIPYIFRSGSRVMPQSSNASETAARIQVHLDTCTGSTLTSIPLQPALHKDGAVMLPAVSFSQQQGRHGLRFEVEGADPPTVWLLHTIQPIPNSD